MVLRQASIVLALSSATLVASRALSAEGPGLTLCLFRALTHVPCPSCGLTRAFIAMAHGRLAHAAVLHPLGPGLFLCVGALALVAALELMTGRGLVRALVACAWAPFVAQAAAQLASLWLGLLAGLPPLP
jgi:Protein of unknown function (DUF2752)